MSSRPCARLGGEGATLWHGDRSIGDVDAVVVPGGFAHGDYLRPGAIARFSPIMTAVAEFANSGGPVVGICNGFQVLTEAGLLPGALQKNRGLKFLCQMTELEVAATDTALTSDIAPGTRLRIPINHFEGNYTCSAETLASLVAEDRVVFRYVENPNGSMNDIAGICNAGRNVVGLMPHPERASSALLGSTDGVIVAALAVVERAASHRRAAARRLGAGLSERAAGSVAPADIGLLEHLGSDPDGAPRQVADSLVVAVGLGHLDELGFEFGEVGGDVGGLEFGRQIHLLLYELQATKRISGGQFIFYSRQPVAHRIFGALAAPLWFAGLECFEIIRNHRCHFAAGGQCSLVLCRKRASLWSCHVDHSRERNCAFAKYSFRDW